MYENVSRKLKMSNYRIFKNYTTAMGYRDIIPDTNKKVGEPKKNGVPQIQAEFKNVGALEEKNALRNVNTDKRLDTDGVIDANENIVDIGDDPYSAFMDYCKNPSNPDRLQYRNISHVELDSSFYIKATHNCVKFRETRGYIAEPMTEEEREFPIAYSIIMYRDVDRAERLLRAIYQPQNYYCIHVDKKAQKQVHEAMDKIASCLENVFAIKNPVSVKWGDFSVLESELICMKELWKYKWKYFINLTGQEYPLKTNWEIVQILKAYNGANDVEGTAKM